MTIKELREQKNLSQLDLAKALGITKGAVAHLDYGRMKISAKIAAKVKELYGVEVTDPEGTAFPAKTAPKKTAEKKSPEKKPARAAAKRDPGDVIVIQSPMGGEITVNQVQAKLPEGADCVFVRVDQNKLWWIMGEETGNVDIW